MKRIDKLDLEIIKHLQDDGRMSFRELGRKLDVPHTTIFTRVNRLMDQGVIKKFSAVIHPHEIGFQIGYVIINTPPSQSKKVAIEISKFNEARKVFRTVDGKVIVKTVVPNHTVHDGLEKFLMKLNGHEMSVYPIHDVVKFDHTMHEDALKELLVVKELVKSADRS